MLYRSEQNAEFVITVPTKNGWHIHTKPFNYTKIQEEKIDMHKNNPTVLYIPKSLDIPCTYENYTVVSTYKTGVKVDGRTKIGTVNVCKCNNCGNIKEVVGVAQALANSNQPIVPAIMVTGDNKSGTNPMDVVGMNMLMDLSKKLNK